MVASASGDTSASVRWEDVGKAGLQLVARGRWARTAELAEARRTIVASERPEVVCVVAVVVLTSSREENNAARSCDLRVNSRAGTPAGSKHFAQAVSPPGCRRPTNQRPAEAVPAS